MTEPHKVMIIDGNVLDVLAAERSLRGSDFTVCHLTTAAGAAARLAYEEPDILLVDPSMPRLGVHELLQVIEQPPLANSTLVLVFTKGDRAALEAKAQSLGAHGFYGKSEPITELGPFLRKAIEDRAASFS